jgi:glycerophosphoryl diester phosphodiesterase
MKKNTPLNIAHRGARSIAPENTLLAAQKAVEIGADLWEMDVAMTADGEIVVIHDDTLERTSNAAEFYPDRRPWKVETFTLNELRRLDFGSWFLKTDPFKQIASGAISQDDRQQFAGLPIPTLEEALLFTRNHSWRINIEIKDLTGKPGDQEVVEKVVKIVHGIGMEPSTIISSFNHAYLRRVKLAQRQIRTAALVEDPALDPVQLLVDLKAQAYNPSLDTLKVEQIRQVRSAGFDVFVWTVNDQAVMELLIEAGVSGLFTDFPQVLKVILDN